MKEMERIIYEYTHNYITAPEFFDKVAKEFHGKDWNYDTIQEILPEIVAALVGKNTPMSL